MIKRTFLLLGIISLVSCTNEIEESVPTTEGKQIVMTVKDFKWDNKDSRTTINPTPEGVFYNWAENDTVGIFPNEGAQAYFPMTSGAGSNTATFNGGGWALKPSSTYAAYYPFIKRLDFEKDAIPVNYEGQTQVSNMSTAHLGKYDFMAAVAKTPENGNVNFDFEHLGALVELNITLPKASTYTKVTLNCKEPVFPALKGKVDITSANPEIVTMGAKSKKLTINLKDFVTTKKNETVKVYFMTSPVDLTGKDIEVYVSGSAFYKGLVNIENLSAGFAYSLNVTDVPKPPYDETLWADLGLPSGILWATKNIGAINPEDCGDYFAWGEIAPKSSYDDSNSLTIYKEISDISGNPQYDAATANWGAPVRIPNDEEIDELVNNCTTTWTIQSGVMGQLVTGPNNNNIFFPASGLMNGTLLEYKGVYGEYWGSTPLSYFGMDASILFFCKDDFSLRAQTRSYGIPVRPVRPVRN